MQIINNIEYFEVPGYPNYIISKCGNVYNKVKNIFLTGSVNPKGYLNFRLSNNGKAHTFGLHRLLGIVFIPLPELETDYKKLVINHIDGVKSNNTLSNLEWTTQHGNVLHAGLNGLSTKCKPILVRDVKTKLVTEYDSYLDCGIDLGFSKDQISNRVNYKIFGQIFPEYKQYKHVLDTRDWIDHTDIEKNINLYGRSNVVLLKYVLSNKVLKFNKMSDLAKHLNLSSSTITKYVKRKEQPLLPGFLLMKLEKDNIPWRIIEDPYYEIEIFNNIKPIVHINNGKIAIYENIYECSRGSNISIPAIYWRLHNTKTKSKKDSNKFIYYHTYRLGPDLQ